MGSGDVEPAVGKGRRRFSEVFLGLFVDSFGEEMRLTVFEVVNEVKYKESHKVGPAAEVLVCVELTKEVNSSH